MLPEVGLENDETDVQYQTTAKTRIKLWLYVGGVSPMKQIIIGASLLQFISVCIAD